MAPLAGDSVAETRWPSKVSTADCAAPCSRTNDILTFSRPQMLGTSSTCATGRTLAEPVPATAREKKLQ